LISMDNLKNMLFTEWYQNSVELNCLTQEPMLRVVRIIHWQRSSWFEQASDWEWKVEAKW
jgi:hypothetical protein